MQNTKPGKTRDKAPLMTTLKSRRQKRREGTTKPVGAHTREEPRRKGRGRRQNRGGKATGVTHKSGTEGKRQAPQRGATPRNKAETTQPWGQEVPRAGGLTGMRMSKPQTGGVGGNTATTRQEKAWRARAAMLGARAAYRRGGRRPNQDGRQTSNSADRGAEGATGRHCTGAAEGMGAQNKERSGRKKALNRRKRENRALGTKEDRAQEKKGARHELRNPQTVSWRRRRRRPKEARMRPVSDAPRLWRKQRTARVNKRRAPHPKSHETEGDGAAPEQAQYGTAECVKAKRAAPKQEQGKQPVTVA